AREKARARDAVDACASPMQPAQRGRGVEQVVDVYVVPADGGRLCAPEARGQCLAVADDELDIRQRLPERLQLCGVERLEEGEGGEGRHAGHHRAGRGRAATIASAAHASPTVSVTRPV